MLNLTRPNTQLSVLQKSLFLLPTPSSLSLAWNFGFILGAILRWQILTGLFLAIHFSGDVDLAFSRVVDIMNETNGGWLTRMAHANGARAFFVGVYIHISRGIYYGSFLLRKVWNIGVLILLLLMATAFMGYVLPWGQMSFWGATVITGLFQAIPLLGRDVVTWLWGGFSVGNPTLTRFFAFHFIAPFVILGAVGAHVILLHERGSSNPLGLSLDFDKISFHPYFVWKDLLALLVFMAALLFVVFFFPWKLGDPENFITANPLVTPVHIQPEWYFLFAYAILRSIPNKLGGVVALALSVLVLAVMPFYGKSCLRGLIFGVWSKVLFWGFVGVVVLLTWVGASPVEHPFIFVGQRLTCLYFFFYLLLPIFKKIDFWVMSSCSQKWRKFCKFKV